MNHSKVFLEKGYINQDERFNLLDFLENITVPTEKIDEYHSLIKMLSIPIQQKPFITKREREKIMEFLPNENIDSIIGVKRNKPDFAKLYKDFNCNVHIEGNDIILIAKDKKQKEELLIKNIKPLRGYSLMIVYSGERILL
jgi:hypothetical protein